MAYRNKVFVSFDGDNDMHYYRLMRAWKQSDNTQFDFYDAHELCQSRDSSLEETIKRSLRNRLVNSKTFVLLIGEHTRYLFKFVRWEMEQALSLDLPFIAVNLNQIRRQDIERCPPLIRDSLAVHISFNARIMQFALENWPTSHENLKRQYKSGPYYYDDSVYNSLGL